MKKIFFFVLLALSSALTYKFIPNYLNIRDDKTAIRVSFINQWPGFSLDELPIIQEVLKERYKKIIIDHDNYDLIIDGVGNDQKITNSNSIKLFFTGEAKKPNIDKYDLSIGFDYIDDDRYIRIPLYYMYFTDKINTNFSRGECNVDKPYVACFLVSNGAQSFISHDGNIAIGTNKRDNIFHKLSDYKFVASGGKHLNNIGGPVPRSDTMKWLGQCKFIIAYENHKYKGYVTEKVFQAYIAGAIPIYWGDKDGLSSDINKGAVIYADDFANENELVEYIKKVDNDNELYCKIWDNQIVPAEENNYDAVKNKLRTKIFKLLDKRNQLQGS